ncbi:MAG TPA: glycine betaine ABC transporter substrate-binding protein [Devosiaceae bacterium]|nr:glycine betaine ABC transporter substrate-binding protein [Devosiaceae bacterium]
MAAAVCATATAGAAALAQVSTPEPVPEAGPGAIAAAEPDEEVGSICGGREITIADMRWPSATILAHIHSIILFEELGCAARIVSGDIASTGSSMATTQQPAIAPEMWIARIPEIWNSATSAGSVRPVANTFLGGPMEGWFVPKFVADANPELFEAEQLFGMREIFGGAGRSRFVSCPADWACSVINRNLLKAFRLQVIFRAEEPADRFALDQILAEAISRREPIVLYYWQPNAAIARFGLKSLELGLFNPDAWPCLGTVDCPAPQQSSFPAEPVVIAVAQWLVEEAPLVIDYLQQAIMPLDEMNRLLAELNEGGGGPAAVARHFYETRQDLWAGWVPDVLK